MFSAVLLTQILFAAAALAAPSKNSRLAGRLARRAGGAHLSRPVNIIEESAVAAVGNASHVSYSTNWAGAVFDSYPAVRQTLPHAHSEQRH